MATHSRILAWKIPWTEESGGLQSTGLQTVSRKWQQLQDSCLENSMDRGAWRATVHGAADRYGGYGCMIKHTARSHVCSVSQLSLMEVKMESI